MDDVIAGYLRHGASKDAVVMHVVVRAHSGGLVLVHGPGLLRGRAVHGVVADGVLVASGIIVVGCL